MCNLSEGIYEKGIEEGISKIVQSGLRKGLTCEFIADKFDIPIETVKQKRFPCGVSFFCKNMKKFVPVIIKKLCCKDWSRKLIYDTMFLKCFIFVIGETNRRGSWRIFRNMKLRIFS